MRGAISRMSQGAVTFSVLLRMMLRLRPASVRSLRSLSPAWHSSCISNTRKAISAAVLAGNKRWSLTSTAQTISRLLHINVPTLTQAEVLQLVQGVKEPALTGAAWHALAVLLRARARSKGLGCSLTVLGQGLLKLLLLLLGQRAEGAGVLHLALHLLHCSSRAPLSQPADITCATFPYKQI